MHPDWWTIGLQTVNFAILVWLLHRFLYKPVLAMIDARKAAIRQQYDEAKAAENQAKASLQDIESQRANIGAEREAVLKAAGTQAQQSAEVRRSDAEREARALINDARKTIAEERDHALAAVKDAALDTGLAFAQRLLSDLPREALANAWIDRIGTQVKSLSEADLASLVRQLQQAGSLKVVIAQPLPEATLDAWRARLRQLFGAATAIKFEVNPELIAGGELHFPTAVLRFSWQSALAQARAGSHGDSRS
jgi:F-type H+-transporting ATPase subunit b